MTQQSEQREVVPRSGFALIQVNVTRWVNNLRSRWDNSNVKFLGYRPEDDSEIFASEILAKGAKENEIAAQFHGGFYCPMEFSGDTTLID